MASEYGIVQTAYEKMENIDQDSCPVDTEEELSFFSPINIDSVKPEEIIISGIAITEGKFRDVYYSYEEIKKSIEKLNGSNFIVDHGLDIMWKNVRVGKIFQVEASDVLRAALYKARFTDPKIVAELSEGKWRANSVKIASDGVIDPVYGLRGTNLSYENISLTNKPACKACIIIKKELKEKLHELSSDEEKESLKTNATNNEYHVTVDTSEGNSTWKWKEIPMEIYAPPQTTYVPVNEELGKWTDAYINELPDSSFAVVESGYGEGKYENKNARHLPYKDKRGNINLPRLRDALAKVNQIKPICGPESVSTLRSKAQKKLKSSAKRAKIGEYSEQVELEELAEKELIESIDGITKGEGTSEEKLKAIDSALGDHQVGQMDTPSMYRAIIKRIDGVESQITDLRGKEEGKSSEEEHSKTGDNRGCGDNDEELTDDKDKDEKPKTEEPKVTDEKPKDEKGKTEGKDETPKVPEPKVETPKVETPEVETPKPEEKPEEPAPTIVPKTEEVVEEKPVETPPATTPAPQAPVQPPAPVVEKEEPVDLMQYSAAALFVKAHRGEARPEARSELYKKEVEK